MTLAYFPLFPTDFDADTGHLSFAEDGAYNRLLRLSWRCPEAKMPDDLDWICRKARAVTAEDRALIEAILSEFFTREKGKVFQRRLVAEWVKANDAHSRRVAAGKEGGAAKARKTMANTSSNAQAMPEQCSSNQNQNQNQNHNHKEQQQPREAVSPDRGGDNSAAKAESGKADSGLDTKPGAVRVAAQPETQSERADRRVKLLSAMGVGPDGIAGPSRFVGTEADMVEADKWAALGLSVDDQCRLIAERMERMRRKNPMFAVGSFAYFTGAMAELAAARAAPVPTGPAKPQSEREAKMARYAKIAGQGAA